MDTIFLKKIRHFPKKAFRFAYLYSHTLLAQKVYGLIVALLPVWLLTTMPRFESVLDATALIITVPLGIYMLTTKKYILGFARMKGAIMKSNNGFEIKSVRGHYEVYRFGRFVCSGDTERECEEFIESTLDDAA